MNQRKICIVTGSRADYGLLYWIMRELQSADNCQLQLLVTGMHLAPEFGNTWRTIEADGFRIDAKVETQLSSDTSVGVTKTIGLGIIGFGDIFQILQPDLLVVLGDRYEIFAAAQAAYFGKIPIAHLAGGDVTEGAFDEAIRHSITKMSSYHFVTNIDAERRVKQLGESPDRIMNLGSPGIDTIFRTKMLTKSELEQSLNLQFRRRIFLITFHPSTLDRLDPEAQVNCLLRGIESYLDGETSIVFTKANADAGGRVINSILETFVNLNNHIWLFDSLGQTRYLSLMNICDVVIGNSSSGLYEAPSLQKPVVNIGERQKGRMMAASVICCPLDPDEIAVSIDQALTLDCSQVSNPYGDGQSSMRIVEKLKTLPLSPNILQKSFYEI